MMVIAMYTCIACLGMVSHKPSIVAKLLPCSLWHVSCSGLVDTANLHKHLLLKLAQKSKMMRKEGAVADNIGLV